MIRHPGRSLAIVGLVLAIGAGASVAGVWLWASYQLRLGRSALERYHTAEAVPHLQATLSIWPRDPESLLLAARAARRAGSLDEADHFLDRYQDVRGDDENLLLERVFVRAERGDPERVRNYTQALIEQNHPATPLIFEALARGYLRGYQPNKAEILLHDWLQRQPDNPQALLLEGQVRESQLRQSDALKSYRAALEADATFDEARLRLCETLMQLGSTEEALPHLEYLRQRIPNNPMVQVYLARIAERGGRGEEAEQMLDEVLACRPNFAPALAERGKLAWRAGHAVDAEKWLRQAVGREPGDFQARYHLYLSLEKNGKLDEAQKEQEQLRRMEKDMADIQAIVAGKMEQNPHNADLHYQIGTISLRAGAVEEGLRWLHSALKEDPRHQPTHQALMEHYQRIGDFGRAREHRQHLKR
jgi:tetratricopeptide (TPR) repeat protein